MTAPIFSADILGFEPQAERVDPIHGALEEMERDLAQVDPLKRLFDPTFTAVTWEYEGSQLDSPMLPGKLHAKQIEALMWQGRFKWLFWGNQVGKTTLGAIEVVLYALGRHPEQLAGRRPMPPVTWWASALTWELWQDILLPELLTWIPADRLVRAPKPYQQSTNRTIVVRADNGKLSRITGKAAEQGPARYQSKRLHGAWLDEEHPEAVFNELQPRLLRFNGVLINTMTPLKGLTWVYHRIYLPVTKEKRPGMKDEHFVSHAGLADNPSIAPSAIETLKEMLRHAPAQLAARLYGSFVKPEGLVLAFNEGRSLRKLSHADAEKMLRQRRCRVYGGVDFGAWRFAFVLIAIDENDVAWLIDERFIQRGQYNDVLDAKDVIVQKGRAREIHDCVTGWGVSPEQWLGIGDCANPQDLVELNSAMIRIKSPYLFAAVHANNKIIAAGVERIGARLGDGRLLVRDGIGAGQTWMLGMKAGSAGSPVEGSRWRWEIDNWMYAEAKDGKAQDDAPNDHSADGADMMAATRYVVMTAFPGEGPARLPKHPSAQEVEAASQRGDDPPEYDAGNEWGTIEEQYDTINEG